MNRRAFRLIPLALILATAGLAAAPVTAHAAPIDDKQAQADQLEAQINANAERLAALNEQINGLQLELDRANEAIANADALVTTAQEKTKELRTEVAHRAAARLRAGARRESTISTSRTRRISRPGRSTRHSPRSATSRS